MSRKNSPRQSRPNRRYRRLVPTIAVAAALAGAPGLGAAASASDDHRQPPPPKPKVQATVPTTGSAYGRS